MSLIGIGDVIRICETAGRVYRNCRDCTGEYKSLTTEARSLSNLLEDISDKFEKIPEAKRKQLEDAYEPCVDVLQELDKLLIHYNGLDTKSKRAWDRLKWNPDKSRTLRDRLTSSVTMLSSFYTSLIHDNQVLILEALERLEQDYKGGHREESIASLERITSGTVQDDEEEDDLAWTQILRDLEDVGVGKQDALGYRDMIVDWLVKAVNEGRLLEDRQDPPDSFLSMPNDLGPALPYFDSTDTPGMHYLDVPSVYPTYERSQSAPFLPTSPMMTPVSEHHRAQSIPSTVAHSIPEPSVVSSNAASCSSETDDTSSFYGAPEPVYKAASPQRPNTTFVKRVPVPNRAPELSQVAPSFTGPVVTKDSELPQVVPTSTSTFVEAASSPRSIPPLPEALTDYSPPQRAPPPIPPKTPVPPPPVYPSEADDAPALALFPAPEAAPALALPEAYPALALSPVLPEHSVPHFPQTSSAPPLLQTPPSYYNNEGSITADLAWTVQQILAAWSRRDFSSAARFLEELLIAVERGQRVLATGTQPDRRILRHLLGVCNSFTGNFVKAKSYFESVFNGIYFHRTMLDDGDIAAARWLGDVCFHLREHSNAILAWGIAYEGSIGRYGLVKERTRRIGDELRMLDHWLFVFRRIENSFYNNIVPTDIFQQTPAIEKSNIINNLKMQLYGQGPIHTHNPPVNPLVPPMYHVGPRPKIESTISEGFLIAPLISLSAWPLPWDSTFSPSDACQLDRHMNSVRTARVVMPLIERTLPTLTLGDSKKLHFVTKRGSQWLIETVKRSLQEMCIEHAEYTLYPTLVCTINQHRDGFAFSEGLEITFKKLQFRNIYGIKVSDVKWSTRIFGPKAAQNTSTVDFREILKGFLENAEIEAASMESSGANAPVFIPQR